MPLNLCAEQAPTLGGTLEYQTVRANYTAAQTDTALVTAGPTERIAVTRLMVSASKGNSVNVAVVVGFGAVNTPTTTGVVAAHPGIDPGGGFVTGNGAGLLGLSPAAGDDLRITSSVPTGGSIDCCVTYHLLD